MGEKGGRAAVTCAKCYKSMGKVGTIEKSVVEEKRLELVQMWKKEHGGSPRRVIHRIQDAMAACDYVMIKEKNGWRMH